MNQINPLLHQLSFDVKNRKEIFLGLPHKTAANTIMHLSKRIQSQLVSSLSDEQLVEIIEHLDPDEATDIVRLLSKNRREDVIKKFDEELKKSVEILSQFDPQTAAGLMNLDYIQVDLSDTIASIARKFKVHEKRTGRLAEILVMDNGRLIGYLPVHELGFAKSSEKAQKYLKKTLEIKHNANYDDVLHFFRQHPHNKIAVIGDDGNVIGIIYSDNILKILKEQTTSALYDFAGVNDEESVTDSARQKVKSRYKWLIINLGTAFLAAFTVSVFDATISKYVLLAVYMPIVAGMGGNAGTQTLAILVRGIALKQIELKTAWPTLRRELIAGFANGLINGVIVATVVIIFNHDYKIAFILGIAMVLNLVVAAFFGTLVPLIMKKLGKDPATSATIFITTATDVLGFMAFLGLATVVLS